MAKVEAHGIRGNDSRWIRNWLTGRTQRVVIHDETSDSMLVTSGVPQRSVLGPLLFIIYINDLDVEIISKINKFADDTKLCHRAFTERDRATIQSDLNRLIKELETKAAPRLTANEKLHNHHSGVHKALIERLTKLTTEDPNGQLNSVRGVLNTPAHTGPTASATPASNKRVETTNNEQQGGLSIDSRSFKVNSNMARAGLKGKTSPSIY
ncbi:Reverse transcriptase domain [Trinorchestia longiramus]|nr:Reverse transcriptase domain [Trinorchestia longiramus]